MKVQNKRKIVFGIIVGLIFGITITVITSYAVAATLIKSADVSYIDNSNLKATNVQAAIDGTCTKFSNDLATLLDKMYPIGSIYISTSLSTPAQVGSAIGGTWEAYGKGQTLVGVDTSQTEFNTVEKIGGEKVHTLTIKEMPSHNHEEYDHTHVIAVNNGYSGYRGWTFDAQPILVEDGGGVDTLANHGIISNTGGSEPHNNLQPYITVYMYKRTK